MPRRAMCLCAGAFLGVAVALATAALAQANPTCPTGQVASPTCANTSCPVGQISASYGQCVQQSYAPVPEPMAPVFSPAA